MELSKMLQVDLVHTYLAWFNAIIQLSWLIVWLDRPVECSPEKD